MRKHPHLRSEDPLRVRSDGIAKDLEAVAVEESHQPAVDLAHQPRPLIHESGVDLHQRCACSNPRVRLLRRVDAADADDRHRAVRRPVEMPSQRPRPRGQRTATQPPVANTLDVARPRGESVAVRRRVGGDKPCHFVLERDLHQLVRRRDLEAARRRGGPLHEHRRAVVTDLEGDRSKQRVQGVRSLEGFPLRRVGTRHVDREVVGMGSQRVHRLPKVLDAGVA